MPCLILGRDVLTVSACATFVIEKAIAKLMAGKLKRRFLVFPPFVEIERIMLRLR